MRPFSSLQLRRDGREFLITVALTRSFKIGRTARTTRAVLGRQRAATATPTAGPSRRRRTKQSAQEGRAGEMETTGSAPKQEGAQQHNTPQAPPRRRTHTMLNNGLLCCAARLGRQCQGRASSRAVPPACRPAAQHKNALFDMGGHIAAAAGRRGSDRRAREASAGGRDRWDHFKSLGCPQGARACFLVCVLQFRIF